MPPHSFEWRCEMAYELEGALLEVCTCNILCPCWVGEDPDGGTCDGVLTWHVEKGTVNGIDVSGRTLSILTHIPGNILAGNWKVVVYVDDEGTPEQQQAARLFVDYVLTEDVQRLIMENGFRPANVDPKSEDVRFLGVWIETR